MYYLYRHVRLDLNVPFYIGIAKFPTEKSLKKLGNTYHAYYNRAFEKKKSRSTFWKNIANKVIYRIDIAFETNIKEEILNKEVEFIKLYGREDLGLGPLCNLTDGGEGIESYSHTDESKQKIRKSSLGRKHSAESIIKINKRKFKKIIMYNDDIEIPFDSLTSCMNYLKISHLKNISACLNNKRKTAYGYKFKYDV